MASTWLAGADGQRIGSIVGRHDCLHVILACPMLQAFEQRVACRPVKCGEWFVEQQQPRSRRQRPGHRHTLRLAAGEFLGAPASELACVHQIEHLVHAPPPLRFLQLVEPERHVGLDVQVREEACVLGDKGCLAAARANPDFMSRVGHYPAFQNDAPGQSSPLLSTVEASQEAEQCGFPRTRRSEKDRPSGGKPALHSEVEAVAPRIDGQVDHLWRPPRAPWRCASA